MSLAAMLGAWRRVDPPSPRPDPAQVAALAARLAPATRFGPRHRLAVLPVHLGGCGACAQELEDALGAAYGAERCGVGRVETPIDADLLAVTGIGTRAALDVLRRTVDATAKPCVVVAVGDCAATGLLCGGFEAASYTVGDGVRAAAAVDLAIRGAPPPPEQILLGFATVRAALRHRG